MPYLFVDARTYKRYVKFAEQTGTKVEKNLTDALKEWMDETGEMVLDFLIATHKIEAPEVRLVGNGRPVVQMTHPSWFPHRIDE